MNAPAQTAERHLLVVDDDNRIRSLLKEFLARAGFRVTAAPDAAAARKLMASLDYDLVVLDVMMPKRNGFEVLEEVRGDPALAGTRVLMLTAKGRGAEVSKGLSLGADAYMPKPFSTRELVAKVKELLEAGT